MEIIFVWYPVNHTISNYILSIYTSFYFIMM